MNCYIQLNMIYFKVQSFLEMPYTIKKNTHMNFFLSIISWLVSHVKWWWVLVLVHLCSFHKATALLDTWMWSLLSNGRVVNSVFHCLDWRQMCTISLVKSESCVCKLSCVGASKCSGLLSASDVAAIQSHYTLLIMTFSSLELSAIVLTISWLI